MSEQKVQDDYRGVGGSYEIKDGVRVLVTPSATPTDTGGARDKDGKPMVDGAGAPDAE
jgi:hypothetical protein